MALSCAPTFLPLEDRRHGWGDGDPIRIRELGPRSLRLGPSWTRGALAFGPSVGDPIRIRELGTHLLLGLPGLGGERFLFVAEKETEDVVENSLFSFVHRLSATDNLFCEKRKIRVGVDAHARALSIRIYLWPNSAKVGRQGVIKKGAQEQNGEIYISTNETMEGKPKMEFRRPHVWSSCISVSPDGEN